MLQAKVISHWLKRPSGLDGKHESAVPQNPSVVIVEETKCLGRASRTY